ncbi:hypothetical protein QBC43DRAFT_204864 [Cladorrhinum sp. PSN259]|nr:hypothetical protein QBC43DRAFT_204864 [Cladorrhinum sp. PSN259]
MLLIKPGSRAQWLRLALFVAAANPFLAGAHELEPRDHTTTTVTVTTTAAPTTVTVNPNDPTITKPPPGWTSTIGPPDFTSVTTSGCVSFNFIIPPPDHPASTQTVTVTQQSTTTVTNPTRRPLTTQTIWPTPTITVTGPTRTLLSVHCTNTLVVSYYDAADAPATYTFSWWPTTSYVTGLCVTTTTRSTTIPGVTLPTTAPLADWEWFTSGTTLATKYSIAILDLTQVTVPGVTTSTRCNSLNPSPTITTTIILSRSATTTTTATVTGACSNNGGGGGGGGGGEGAKNKRDIHHDDAIIQARQQAPIEVQTVVYTTVTVIDNTIRTLTGTAVLDVVTQSFPRTAIAYVTSTVATRTVTVTSSVC